MLFRQGAVTGLDITFNVPRITGSFSSPFNIIAGLDGIPADALECPYSVQVGLEVKPSKEGKPSYRGKEPLNYAFTPI